MMDDEMQYVDLAPAELPGSVPRPDGGGEGVLYVQDGMVQGPAGEQYVTIIQNGQTYAIPTADYAAMLTQPDMENNSQDIPRARVPEVAGPHQGEEMTGRAGERGQGAARYFVPLKH